MKNRRVYRSVLSKINRTILVFTCLLILFVVIILYGYYDKIVYRNSITRLEYEDRILSQSIDNRTKNTESFCNTVAIYLNESLDDRYLSGGYPTIETATQKKIYKCMINTFTMFDNVEQIIVLWNNGTSFYQSRSENYAMSTNSYPLLEEMRSLGVTRKGFWLNTINSESKIRGHGQYYAKIYTDIDTGKDKGYIIFKINDVFDILEGSSHIRKSYLFDEQQRLIQTSDIEAASILKERDRDIQLDLSRELRGRLSPETNGRKLYTNLTSLENGWILISVSQIGLILHDLHRTIQIIIGLSVFIMGMLNIILYFIVKHIIRPIKELSEHMLQFQSAIPSPISMAEPNDETGVLISHFNKMAVEIKDLFHLVLEEKKMQKQLEFSLLQAQIKPHFLYNTLDTVYCLNSMEHYSEANRMIKLLSDYYRRVLSKGMDWILLSDELLEVEKYLEIQQIRYKNILSYTIECGEVELIKIPKLTLQPLVENAIYHGIKPKKEPGKVIIQVCQLEGVIEIRVIDDGCGFSQEKFSQCLEESGKEETGFGLRNVYDRLKFHYGENVEFSLEERDNGTSVLIRMKIVSEEV